MIDNLPELNFLSIYRQKALECFTLPAISMFTEDILIIEIFEIILQVRRSFGLSLRCEQRIIESTLNTLVITYYIIKNNPRRDWQILDLACGAVTYKTVNYDPDDEFYAPILVEVVCRMKFANIVGVDFRKNRANLKSNYQAITNINLNFPFAEKVLMTTKTKFDLVIFLRSWDTPEIWQFWQNKTSGVKDEIVFEAIKQHFGQQISSLLKKDAKVILTPTASREFETVNNLGLFIMEGKDLNRFEL